MHALKTYCKIIRFISPSGAFVEKMIGCIEYFEANEKKPILSFEKAHKS